jgi:methyl-accepting chemotaxis protein
MTWLRDAKLSTKMLVAFGLCAFITLAVGVLGARGISQLSDSLKNVFANNLVSVSKTAEAKSKAIAQLKDLYALIAAHAENDSQSVKDTIRQAMTTNQADSEKAFAIYRKTPLADDERAAGDQMERDWPIYQAQIQKVLTVLDSGNVQGARALMSGEIQQAYRTVMDELTIMVESNNRQIAEGARDAEEQEQAAITVLYIGIALAFLAALALGLFISRLISRPIATAVASAQLIAKGDLTHTIGSAARDETGQLLTALGEMQEGLKATIHQIADASNQLASAAEELNAVTEDGSRGLLRQNDEIQQAATAVTEMTSAVEEVARNAISTSEASKTASSQATDGLVQARNAVDAVNNATVEIQSSTTIVEDLAARTQSSTGEIESMIGAVRSRADQAVAAMGKSQGLVGDTQVLAKATGEALQSIATGIAQINDRNLVIASACEEQAHVAREVDRNLINIQDLSTQTAAGAHQTSASTQDLSRLATSFNDLVSRFRL